VNPLSFTSGNGASISSSNTRATLTEVTDPADPPIGAEPAHDRERTNKLGFTAWGPIGMAEISLLMRKMGELWYF
jgi:hypothetical protein